MLGPEPAMPGSLTERSCEWLRDRAVLVTGAGGSIGAALARAVHRAGPREIRLLDRSEPDLVEIDRELASSGQPAATPILGDLCDPRVLGEALRGVSIVLHAAAVKQVAFLETQPLEALRVNVLGTRGLLSGARVAGVERVVLMSSDKAVTPTSLLGATKRVVERLAQAAEPSPECVAVRCGNVLGSRGSVLPLFDEQICAGGPVLVTDAGASRFFSSPSQVVDLVLAATWLGEAGDVLVPDLGAPVSILSLARERIAHSGRKVGIRFVGLRPGERRSERLSDPSESLEPTAAPWVRRVKGGPPLASRVDSGLDRIADRVAEGDAAGAIQALRSLVPEWTPSGLLLDAVGLGG
jgi:FlaA1/EpsC-like NDP-sugar epimerase